MAEKKTLSAPFNNPFAALKAPDLPVATESAVRAEKKPALRAVVAREKKDHGGKEMTRITQMALTADDAVAITLKLKKQLGVGGVSEGCDILLQGDQRERVKPFLASLGVTRITIAN